MDKLKIFFKTRGFYVALTVGVVALAVLMCVYDYNNAKKNIDTEVDLSKPYVSGTAKESSTSPKVKEIADASDNDKSDNDNSNNINADDTKDDNKDTNVANNSKADADKPASLDEAVEDNKINEVSTEPVEKTEVVYNYNGDKNLMWPLIGETIIPYSMDTTVYFKTLDVYKCNPGILIGADQGANVAAAIAGRVSDISDTKEYGTVVTLELGNGYEAKYGQLMNVTVSVGEDVAQGQNIGEIAPVSAYYTEEGTHLFFEILKDGQPVNPIEFIE